MPLNPPKILNNGKEDRVSISASELRRLLFDLDIKMAFIEHVHSMPNQGVASSFRFGEGYGLVQGVLYCHPKTPRIFKIEPAVWKSEFNLSRDKSKSIDLAMRMWPKFAQFFNQRHGDGMAEAALIAEYGRRSFYGIS